MKIKRGLVLAAAAAGLIASGAVINTAFAADDVKCVGGNSCKGKSDCKATSACKGQNACKGKGWVKASAEECKKLGGKAEKFTAEEKKAMEKSKG